MSKKLNIDSDLVMKMYFEEKLSLMKIAKFFGCSQIAITTRILEKGGVLRLKSPRSYIVNENFFDNIDTEEKAYWLGFLSADAGISRSKGIRINLNINDKHHLEKLKKDIGSTHPIVEVKKYNREAAQLAIHSFKLYGALQNLGVTERKSFTIKPCEYIPEDLQKHYWRGVFDGNGTIRSTMEGKNKTSKCWRVSLCGTKEMVDGFINFINNYITDSYATARKIPSIYNVEFGGNVLAQKVAKLLYEGAVFYLDRKKELADELINLKLREHFMQGIKSKGSSSKYVGVTKSGKNYWRMRFNF